jgi:hypothetical protein
VALGWGDPEDDRASALMVLPWPYNTRGCVDYDGIKLHDDAFMSSIPIKMNVYMHAYADSVIGRLESRMQDYLITIYN